MGLTGWLGDPVLEDASGTGSYEWRPAGGHLLWSPGLIRLYGLSTAPAAEDGFSCFVHPEDRLHVEAETRDVLSSHAGTYQFSFRIVRPDGSVRQILDRGVIERDGAGRALVLRGIHIDVTDALQPNHKGSPAAARSIQKPDELEALYAEAPLGLGMLDQDLRFVRINPALAEINGFSVEEHLGRRVWDLVPDLRQTAEPALRKVLESGEPLRDVVVRGETPARPGAIREWRENFYPIRNDDGTVQGIGITCQEVTERVATERALVESEERFHNMADNAPVMVWQTDPQGSCTFLSASWYEFTGQIAEEALGFGWLRAVHPEDAVEANRVFREATAGKRGFRLDYRLRRADGVYRWAIDTARPRLGADGEFLGFIGSVMDITERKESEERLRAAHDTFRQLVDRSPFGIYAVDSDFRLVQVSEGAQKVFENIRPVIGRDFDEVMHILWPEPFASEAIGHFRHTLETGEPYHATKTVEQRADINATEAYDWKVERITMPDGRPGVVCHFYDLSEREAHEEKIQSLMREVNHRAKNMLALVDAVAKQTASVKMDDFLERFSARIQALAASQDLLVKTDWDGTDLAALIESQLLHFGDLIGKRITLEGPSVDVSPRAAQSLGMAMHELATNAAKYGALSNDSGRVYIRWSIDGGHADGFSISWREEGGPPVKQPARNGFGARVIKTMIQRMLSATVELDYARSGMVWALHCALSALGKAAKSGDENTSQTTAEPSQDTANGILLVEDDALLAMDLLESLQRAGYTMIGPAASVTQALDLLQHQVPRFAILDVNLGVETSEAIARRLLDMGVPFISVSAYAHSQQPPIFQHAPFLSKPFQLNALLEEIAQAGVPAPPLPIDDRPRP